MMDKFKYCAPIRLNAGRIKAGLTLFLAVCVLIMSGRQASALPEAEISLQQRIDNAGLGFSYALPNGWAELPPLLMNLYNTSANAFAGGANTPYLVAAYSAGGTQFLPPVLLIHFMEQPVTANMVEPLNNLFLEEARDNEGKTRIARKLNLASEVRFIQAKELRPGTPLVISEADASLGFTVRIMAAPFYLSNGVLVATYFAPLGDYELHEDEMLVFFRGVAISPDNSPR